MLLVARLWPYGARHFKALNKIVKQIEQRMSYLVGDVIEWLELEPEYQLADWSENRGYTCTFCAYAW